MAMTRAKKGLYFTSAEDYGGTRAKKLSRFLIELGYKEGNDKSAAGNNLLAERQKVFKIVQKPELARLPDHFSFSQLAAFEKCPLQYKFNFVLKVPIKGKPVFSFGRTMHNALFFCLKEAQGKRGAQDNLFGFDKTEPAPGEKSSGIKESDFLKIYEREWIDEWYENKKQKEEYYNLGKKIIKNFYSDFSKNPPNVLNINGEPSLEMPFNLKIGKYGVRGKIDRIDEAENGVTIIDYKTGGSKEKLDAETKEQLLIYQIAGEEVFGLKPKELVYHYLEDGKKASFLGEEKEKNKLKEKIIHKIEEIRTSDFKPTPGWQCEFCDFKDICDFRQK